MRRAWIRHMMWCLVVVAVSPCALAQPTLDEIRAAYAEQIGILDQIEVEVSVVVTPTEEALALNPDFVVGTTLDLHYRIVRDGSRWLQEGTHSRTLTNDRPGRSYKSFDADRSWNFIYSNDDGEKLERVQIGPRDDPRRRSNGHLEVAAGRSVFGNRDTLLELFDANPAAPVEAEDVEGVECWKVTFGEQPVQETGSKEVVVWFDPAARYLPRKVYSRVILPAEANSGQAEQDREKTVTVSEFLPIEGEGGDAQRWIIRDAIIESGTGGRVRVHVEQARIASGRPAADFTPAIPDGVVVEEAQPNGEIRKYVAGGAQSVDEAMQSMAEDVRDAAEEADPIAPVAAPAVDARPPSPYAWAWWVGAISVLIAVSAGLVYLRQ